MLSHKAKYALRALLMLARRGSEDLLQVAEIAEVENVPRKFLEAILGELAKDGIAVRVSAHPVVVALCDAFGGALVSTSANIATLPAPRTREELDPRIVAGVDAVAPGETGGLLQATPIRDARDGRSLR